MPSDSSIYGLIRQPTIEPLQSPEEREVKRMTLRNLALQGEGAALGLQQKRDEIGTQRRLQDFISANPNATADQIAPIDYRAAAAMRKEQLEAEGKRATIGHTNAQAGNINAGHIAGAFAALAKGGGSDASVQAARDVLAQTVGPERAAQTMAPLMGMPPELRLAYAVQSAGMHKVGQEAIGIFFPKAELRDTGGAIVPVNTSTIPGGAGAGAVLPGATPIQKTATPEALLADRRAKDSLAETIRNNQRPVYDAERGGYAERPRPGGAAPAFIPVAGAPKGQKELIASREDADNLRKEFEAKETVKRYRDVVPIAAAAQKAPDTRSGDIQMAYAVGKILDPASVVREGELKLVGDAATVMGKIEGELRTLTQGKGRLTPETRAALNAMLSNAVTERKTSFDTEKKSYEGIVTRRGYKPEDVFIDVPAERRADQPTQAPRPKGKEQPLGGGRGKFLGFE